ncbi:hypothetical protein H2198_000368 [Neophaeococcomyces mojaviensis]|uniref:Uncharacterized protein n=1 Tax=Neophaeococcomyces mojaviensis TaxID=3383035 RepID=A0ACC3AKF6_9EURO|nr:hypothetical protein H2198_000368 [Knufia sp. JES_112]
MSVLDIAALPTPEHLTLLFKHGKSTTVLSVLPSHRLSEVKAMLLTALQTRGISTFPGTGTLLPTKPDEIELAVLVDRRDPHKGWVNAEDGISLAASKAGKKKSSKPSGPISDVGDLELKDGAWIAYRLKTPDVDIVEEGSSPDIEMREDPGWYVTIPSYDDEEEDMPLPNDLPAIPVR